MTSFRVVINPITGFCLIVYYDGSQIKFFKEDVIEFFHLRGWKTVQFFIEEKPYTLMLEYRNELIPQVIEGEYELKSHPVEIEFVHSEKDFRRKVVYAQKRK